MYDVVVTWSILLVAAFLIHLFTSTDSSLRKVLYFALLARVVLMVIDVYIYSGLPYLTAADAGRFQGRAIAFYQTMTLQELLSPPYPSGSGLYSYMMAIFYSFFGTHNSSIIRAVNILAGVFTVYNAYHISNMLWGRKIALQNALILAIFPLLVVYAQNPIRESFVVYFMTLGFMYFVSWYQYKRPHYLVLSIFGFALSTALHMAALMALLALVVYNMWVMANSMLTGKVYMLVHTFFAVAIAVMGLYYLNTTGWGLGTIGGEGAIGEFGVEELIEARGGDRRMGRAAYLTGMTAGNPSDVVWQTPVRAVYFLFTPFPWMMSSVWDIVGLFDALLYLLLFWGIYKSFPLIKADPVKLSVFFMLIGMIIAFAWGVTNFGTGMRHRAKIVPIIICLAPHLYPLRKVVYNKVKGSAGVVWISKRLRP